MLTMQWNWKTEPCTHNFSGEEEKKMSEHNEVLMSLDEQVDELVKLATRRHYWCDDSYYSCPATEEGCSNPAYEDIKECQCGADEHNAKVASLAAEIKARIKANETFL